MRTTVTEDIAGVLEYLWKASHVFYKQGDPRCEQFVFERLFQVLRGQSNQVAEGILTLITELVLSKKEA